MDRSRADYMGMLGTVMNCLALQDFLEKAGRRDPGADRDRDGPGGRAVHPAPRHPAPREGPRRHLRRRPRRRRSSPPTPAPPSARWRSVPRSCSWPRASTASTTRTPDDPTPPSSTTSTMPRCWRVDSRSPTPRRSACAWTTTCRSSCSTCSRRATSPAPSGVRGSARWSRQPYDRARRTRVRADRRASTRTTARRIQPPQAADADVIDETLLEAEEKMEKAVTVAKEDFASIRTGRATPGDVQQDRRRLLRRAHAHHSSWRPSRSPRRGWRRLAVRQELVHAIEKAIRDSDLGVNPTNDGSIIRVVLPAADRGAPQGVHQGR